MQKAHIFRQVRDRVIVNFFGQRMIKRNIDAAIAVFYIENNGVSARLVPMSYQFNAMCTAGRSARHINRADFSLFCEWTLLFRNWLWLNAGNQDGLAFFE